MRFYDPCNDVAFKRVFGHSTDLTVSFLNAIFRFTGDRVIRKVSFPTASAAPQTVESKKSILDIKCTDHLGFQYMVQVQNKTMQPYVQNIQNYLLNHAEARPKRSHNILELKPVILLNIFNHTLFTPDVPYLSFQTFPDKNPAKHSYIEDMAYVFLELPKFYKPWKELSDLTDHWIYFLKESMHLENIPFQAPQEIQEALAMLEVGTWAEKEQNAYIKSKDVLLGDGMAFKNAKQDGVREGSKTKSIEIALNLFKLNMDIPAIAQATGLSEEEIKSLKSNQK
jgi:predicted transposase/invertase (TIGR01784 family)